MRKSRPIYNVFISSPRDGQATAQVLGRLLADAGLKPFEMSSLTAGAATVDSIREALAESDAFVVILTPTAVTSPNVGVELGAAMALQKPIYLLLLEELMPIPEYLQQFRCYPASKIQEMVRSIAREGEPLTDADRQGLMRAYAQLGIPSDRLVSDPDALHRLTMGFTEQTGRTLSSERLVRELFRLRKVGQLPRLRRNAVA